MYINNKTKFDPRAIKYVFLGYSPTQKKYKCYDPYTKRIVIASMLHFLKKYLTTKSPFFNGRIWKKMAFLAKYLDLDLDLDFTIPKSTSNITSNPPNNKPITLYRPIPPSTKQNLNTGTNVKKTK